MVGHSGARGRFAVSLGLIASLVLAQLAVFAPAPAAAATVEPLRAPAAAPATTTTTIPLPGPVNAGPHQIALDAAGNIYVTQQVSSTVSVIPKTTGTLFGQAVTAGQAVTLAAATGLAGPVGIAVDAAGNLYVANNTPSSITVLPKTSGTIFGQAATANVPFALGWGNLFNGLNLYAPLDIAVDAAGNLFVSGSQSGNCVTVLPKAGGTVFGSPVTANVPFLLYCGAQPFGLAFDATGNLFIANANANNVVVFPSANGTVFGQAVTANVSTVVAAASGLSYPTAVAFDAAGDMVIANAGNHTATIVAKATGTLLGQPVTQNASTAFGAANGLADTGVAFDAAGNLFTNNYAANTLTKFSAATATGGTWPGEGSGADVSGNANNGTLLGNAGFAPGIIGQAFSFDGNSPSSVNIAYSASLAPATYSVSTWVKPLAMPSGQVWLFGENYARAQLNLEPGTTGPVVRWGFGTAASQFPGVLSTTQLPLGAWSHLAGTWDGSTLKLYVNGVLDAQLAPGLSPNSASTCGFHIGGSAGDATCPANEQFFAGLLDEVAYTDRVLAAADVLALSRVAPSAPLGVSAVAGTASATVSFSAPASSGSSPITTYTVSASNGGPSASGSSSPIVVTGLAAGTYTFTVTATNAAGTSVPSAPSGSVTVNPVPVDTTPPTITAPAPVTVSTDPGRATASHVALGAPVASDDSGAAPTVTNDAPAVFPLGATTVTWTATDAAHNSASDRQLVTVLDTERPTITAPAAVSAATAPGGTTAAVALGTATATDNSGHVTVTNNAPALFPVGPTTVTWTATDPAGNTATATQLVTVTATAIPLAITWGTPADITYGTALGAAQLNATANVPGTFTYAPAAGTFLGAGPRTITATFTPTDLATYAVTTKTVSLNVLPAPLTITASSPTMYFAEAVNNNSAPGGITYYGGVVPAITPVYSPFKAGDTASSAVTTAPTCTTTAVASSPLGTYPSTCSGAVAANYAITYAPGTVTVKFDPAAKLSFDPPNITVNSSDLVWSTTPWGYAGYKVYLAPNQYAPGFPLVDSNPRCNPQIYNPPADVTGKLWGLYKLGTTSQTWIASDLCGNSNYITRTVTVRDTTPPVLTPPVDVTYRPTCAGGSCTSFQVTVGRATATDNSGSTTIWTNYGTAVVSTGVVTLPAGVSTIYWYAADPSGNSAYKVQTVNVIPPTVVGAQTPAGNNVTVAPTDTTTLTAPVSLTFSGVITAGKTTLTTAPSGPAAPAGYTFQVGGVYYNLATTAVYTGTIKVCITNSSVTANDRLLHYEAVVGTGGRGKVVRMQWVDHTVYPVVPPTICTNVGSLSPFAIAQGPADQTPPDAVVGFDAFTQTLSVTGRDSGSGVAPDGVSADCAAPDKKDDDHDVGSDDADGNVQLCTYTITDNSSNTTTLVLRVKQEKTRLTVSEVSVQYGDAAPVVLPANKVVYDWSADKNHLVTKLDQSISYGKGKQKIDVTARFGDGKTDVTKIRADLPGKDNDVRKTVDGLDALVLVTSNGALSVEF